MILLLQNCWMSVLEVSGHVGGVVSILCPVSQTKDNNSQHSNMYLCKGVCSRENILIQTENKRSAVTWQGRYNIEVNRGDGVFNVTIKKLKRSDEGRYCCGMEKPFNVLYQEVNLIVLDGDKTCSDINVEGFEGGEVSFQSSHRLAWKYNKYLCRDPCKETEDILATVKSGKRVESGRITLVDSGDGVFNVTFSQLRLSDSGKYWCGVDRPGFDTFTAVTLTVKERKCDFFSITMYLFPLFYFLSLHSPLVGKSQHFRGKYFMMIMSSSHVCMSIQHLHLSCCSSFPPQVNHGDHHYEEILGKKDSGGVVSSVYANVSSPTDQLHYASVNFQNDSTTVLTNRNAPPDTDKNGSSTCDYSSISGTPNLYSTVIKPEGP
uniref:Immunoglobulin domain-containing protein n=1 Tax=Lates calcarifer TaxID=8187 RepID=A0A4W6DHF4_LATCA